MSWTIVRTEEPETYKENNSEPRGLACRRFDEDDEGRQSQLDFHEACWNNSAREYTTSTSEVFAMLEDARNGFKESLRLIPPGETTAHHLARIEAVMSQLKPGWNRPIAAALETLAARFGKFFSDLGLLGQVWLIVFAFFLLFSVFLLTRIVFHY